MSFAPLTTADFESAVDIIVRRYDDDVQARALIQLLLSDDNVRYLAAQRAYSYTLDCRSHFHAFTDHDSVEV